MNAAEARLVKALRSGKYVQTRGRLRRGTEFCCLGVACDLFDPSKWHEVSGYLVYMDINGVLPFVVKDALDWFGTSGLTSLKNREGGPLSLTDLNDDDPPFTFDQIADIIQAGFVLNKGETF